MSECAEHAARATLSHVLAQVCTHNRPVSATTHHDMPSTLSIVVVGAGALVLDSEEASIVAVARNRDTRHQTSPSDARQRGTSTHQDAPRLSCWC